MRRLICTQVREALRELKAAWEDKNCSDRALYASVLGHVSCVEVLLQAGAVVDRVDPAGVTALMLSASRGHCQACSALLEAGAQLTVKAAAGPYAGQTALDVAIAAFERRSIPAPQHLCFLFNNTNNRNMGITRIAPDCCVVGLY